MYYIFYKTEDGFSPSNDPQGAFLTQDISSYSLQQGDDIYIEWSLGIPNLFDNQLPFLNSAPPMTWSGASYPDTIWKQNYSESTYMYMEMTTVVVQLTEP